MKVIRYSTIDPQGQLIVTAIPTDKKRMPGALTK